MTLNEYQAAAQRTSGIMTSTDHIINGLLGLFGEGGECADIMKKCRYQGHNFDREHMVRELGDVLWYVAEVASGLGVTLDEVAKTNIDKLLKRYPAGFNTEKSQHRAAGDV